MYAPDRTHIAVSPHLSTSQKPVHPNNVANLVHTVFCEMIIPEHT